MEVKDLIKALVQRVDELRGGGTQGSELRHAHTYKGRKLAPKEANCVMHTLSREGGWGTAHVSTRIPGCCPAPYLDEGWLELGLACVRFYLKTKTRCLLEYRVLYC